DRPREEARDRLVEAQLRRRAVESAFRRRPELGQEPRRFGQGRIVAGQRRETQQLADRAVGELLLVARAADGDGRASRGSNAREELLREPRLADPRLAADEREPPVRADRAVRVLERAQLEAA